MAQPQQTSSSSLSSHHVDENGLLHLASTDVTTEMSQSVYIPVISHPPFIPIPGTFNTRDLGLLPSSPVRPGLIFRSGGLTLLASSDKEAGQTTIKKKYNIKRIFDLRSAGERQRDPEPEVPGVETTWVKGPKDDDSKVDLAWFIEGDGEFGYRKMYMEVLEDYKGSWAAILEHIRDRPEEPFLVHCTAGRDRTGVLSGLLLSLAGASPDTVTLDYLLSRIGTEPMRITLLAFAKQGTGVTDENTPGFRNLCNLTATAWMAFVEAVGKEYGGFEGFVTKQLGFKEDDLAKIKENLTGTVI